jgi:hypothetical protein
MIQALDFCLKLLFECFNHGTASRLGGLTVRLGDPS